MNTRTHTSILVLSIVALTNLTAELRADESEAITPEAVELGRPVDFNKDILPIFRANCLACHNRSKAEGELTLESQATILKGSSSGEIVVPGKPDESYLYNVAARVEESYMPPMPNSVQAKKLTPKELWLLRQWIVEGAKPSKADSSATINWQKINSQLKAVYSVDADPWGRFVAAGRAGNVAVYDLANAGNVKSLVDPALKELSPQQQAHRDYVHAIAFHPSGEMIATSGYRVVKLWERDFDSIAKNVDGLGAIRSVLVSPDRSLVALQNEAGVIGLTNGTGDQISKLPLDSKHVLHAVGGPENSWLLVSKPDGILSVVNRDGETIASGESSGAKNPLAVFTASNAIVVCTAEGGLQRFTVTAGEKKLAAAQTAKSDKGAIRQISVAGTSLMCRVEGQVVEIRNAENLSLLKTLQSGSPNSSAAISSNGERVTTISPEGVAELWNAKDAKLIATLNKDVKLARIQQAANLDKTVRDARVTVVKGQITEAEKRVTEQKDSLKKAEEAVKKATEALAAAKKKYAEETPKLAAAKKASDEKPDDAGLKKKLEAAQKAETTAKDAVAAAERGLASANKSVELTKQAITRAEANVANQQKLLAAVEAEAKASADAQGKAAQAAKATVSGFVAEFLSDAVVATTSNDGHLRLWNATDGKPIDAIAGEINATPTSNVIAVNGRLLIQSESTVKAVNGFPAWKMTVSLGGSADGAEFADRVLSLAFSPDGKLLVAGGGEASRSGEVTIWDVGSKKLLRRLDDAHSDTVCGLDISPDGKYLASAASDRFVKVFDLRDWGTHPQLRRAHTPCS